MTQCKERVQLVDLAKGLGMILVIIGHSGIPIKLQWWIWSFHMPLFFIISGFLYNHNLNISFIGILTKKTKSLLVPYLYFTLIILVLLSIIKPIFILNILKDGWGGIALWFIPVLFVTECLFFFSIKYLNSYLLIAVTVLCSLLGYYFGKKNIHAPYQMDVVLMALFFYGSGFILKKGINLLRNKGGFILFLLCATLLLVNIITCFSNYTRFDMCTNTVGNYFYGVISAFSGVFFILLISELADMVINKKIKEAILYIGKNTLILLCIHQTIMLLLIALFKKISIHIIASTVIRHGLFWTILMVLIFIINENFPFLLGRKRIKKIH